MTALRTEDLLQHCRRFGCEVDSGYPSLARDYPGQVTGPPQKPGKGASADGLASWEAQRKDQSSRRICIEHAIAEPKQWRPLQRYLTRRDYSRETAPAIAKLVSDRYATLQDHPAQPPAQHTHPQSRTNSRRYSWYSR